MYSDFAVLLGMTYVFLPLMVLPVYAAIEKFDSASQKRATISLMIASLCLRRVILPLIRPGIIAGSILVFVPSLGAYVTPRVMGGGKSMMLGNLIDLQFGQGRNWPLGAALSITLTVLVLVALIWYTRLTSDGRSATMLKRNFDVTRLPGTAVIAITCFVILYIPMAILVGYSFNSAR